MIDSFDVTEVDLSNFSVYEVMAGGYSWVDRETIREVVSTLNSDGIEAVLSSRSILNRMGVQIANMPYTEDDNHIWEFRPQIMEMTSDDDLKKMDVIGDIYKTLIEPISNPLYVYFTNKTSFILYNGKVEVSDDRSIVDVNMVNVLINVLSIFIVQTYKRKRSE